MKIRNLFAAGALVLLLGNFQAALAAPGTQIDLTFQGMNLTRFGGPVTDVLFSLRIPQGALDQSPESPLVSQFAGDVEMGVNGQTFSTFGFLQLQLPRPDLSNPYQTTMVFTIAFPGEHFPGQTLNTQISGIELHLYDNSSPMVTSEAPGDMATDFASKVASFRYFLRVGGWSAGQGTFHEYTNDSVGTAHFLSQVTSLTAPIPEPETYALMLAGLGLLGFAARRRNQRASA